MRRARNLRTDTFFEAEVEMTIIYEKTSEGKNEWLFHKDDQSIDPTLVEYLRVEEDMTVKQAFQTVIEDDGLTNFNRIDVELMLIAWGVLDRWYESGDLLPLGRYRMNAGYMERLHNE